MPRTRLSSPTCCADSRIRIAPAGATVSIEDAVDSLLPSFESAKLPAALAAPLHACKVQSRFKPDSQPFASAMEMYTYCYCLQYHFVNVHHNENALKVPHMLS